MLPDIDLSIPWTTIGVVILIIAAAIIIAFAIAINRTR